MAEIADADLPVLPFRVNWKAGVAERLEWKTDILGDFKGNEQRRALRLTPRREFEVTISLWDQDRQFWDLWCHRMAGTEFLMPVWHDSVRIGQEAPGGQKTVWVDTRGLEFREGSYALLRGLTALSWERVQIAEVHDDRIVTVDNLVATWRKGTRVEPLIRGRMTDQTDVKARTSRVSETQAVFQATREQPLDEGVDTWDQYQDIPVLAVPPNRTDDISSAFQWAFSESDSQTGRRYRESDTGRAIVHQRHSFMLVGRQSKLAFRQLCYRLRGAARPIWLPTFNEDMTLTRDRPVGATSIYVKAFGFAYTGGPTSGREHIVIQLRNGTRLYRKVIATAASGTVEEERLVLDTPLPGLTMAEVGRISWMDTSRFENDRIEFSHINAADGSSTVVGVFQSFRNERTAPTVLQLPIPDAEMFPGTCGPNPPDQDFCAPIFPGWYWRIAYKIHRTGPGNQPMDLYNGGIPIGGLAEVEVRDPTNSYWSFLIYDNPGPPANHPAGRGEGPFTWTIQFLAGWGTGTACYEEAPSGNCIAEVQLQHWTMAEPVVVVTGEHFGLFPMYWTFNTP